MISLLLSSTSGRHLLTLALVAGLVGPVAGQSRVSTSAAQFLTLGTGARGSALGHAYTATVTGADALFWNPAGASRITGGGNRGSLFLSHSEWLADINYNAVGLVVPVTESGVAGLSLAQLDYGRMDVRTEAFPEGTGETFGSSDIVVGLSYSQPLTNSFFIGSTLKFVRQAIYDMSAQTMAFDIGFVLVSDYLRGLRLAASIMNFGGRMQMGGVNSRIFVDIDQTNEGSNIALPAQLETASWDLPLAFKFGAALPVISTNSIRLEVFSDANQTNDNDLNADLGSELRFFLGSVNLDLRAGYKDFPLDTSDSHLTLGGGIDLNLSSIKLAADFAYIPFEKLGHVSVLDIKLFF
ncbi:MAG TPA: PorV/PorQ family protein [Rhodothermales bacterium]|nr:PorV/PorQ family protein [Rhodothermales bacterium]